MKKQKKRRRAAPRPEAQLYAPLAGIAELAELERKRDRNERGWTTWFRVFVALAALLALINLLTTFSGVELRVAERVWSLLAIVPLAAITAIWWAEAHLVRRRALEAQQILLAQRELNRQATGIRAAEERLRGRLERLSPRHGDLEALLTAAEGASQRLLRLADVEEARGDLPERAARLDAYRVALDNIGIDALLDPELLRSPVAGEVLDAATRLLAGGRFESNAG